MIVIATHMYGGVVWYIIASSFLCFHTFMVSALSMRAAKLKKRSKTKNLKISLFSSSGFLNFHSNLLNVENFVRYMCLAFSFPKVDHLIVIITCLITITIIIVWCLSHYQALKCVIRNLLNVRRLCSKCNCICVFC